MCSGEATSFSLILQRVIMISDTLKFFEYSHTKNTTCLETIKRIQCCQTSGHRIFIIYRLDSFSIQITTAIYIEYHFLRYGNSFCHFSSAFRQIKLNIRTSFKYYIRSLIILKKLATIAGFCFVVLTQYIFSILVPQKQLRYLDILCFRYGNKIAG